jgi:hypothetical protein
VAAAAQASVASSDRWPILRAMDQALV